MDYKDQYQKLFVDSKKIAEFAENYSNYLNEKNKNFISKLENDKKNFEDKMNNVFSEKFIVVYSELNSVGRFAKNFDGLEVQKRYSTSKKASILSTKNLQFAEVEEKVIDKLILDDNERRYLPGRLCRVVEDFYQKNNFNDYSVFLIGHNIKKTSDKLDFKGKIIDGDAILSEKKARVNKTKEDTLKAIEAWVTKPNKQGESSNILNILDDIKNKKAFLIPRRNGYYCDLEGNSQYVSYIQAFWAINRIKENILKEENEIYYALVKYGDLKRIMKNAELEKIPDLKDYAKEFYLKNEKAILEGTQSISIEDDKLFSVEKASSFIYCLKNLDTTKFSEKALKSYNEIKDYASYKSLKVTSSDEKTSARNLREFCNFTQDTNNVKHIRVSILDKYPMLQFIYEYAVTRNLNSANTFLELI